MQFETPRISSHHDCFSTYCQTYCHYLNTVCYSNNSECDERNSFGGIFVISAQSCFRDGKLAHIAFSFHSRDFDSLFGAAIERLGEPTKALDKPIQTRAGAKFENRIVTWERPDMILTVERYGSNS